MPRSPDQSLAGESAAQTSAQPMRSLQPASGFATSGSLPAAAATGPLLSLRKVVCPVASQDTVFVRGKILTQSARLDENCVGKSAAA